MPTLVAESVAPTKRCTAVGAAGSRSEVVTNPAAKGATTPTTATTSARGPTPTSSSTLDSIPTMKRRSVTPRLDRNQMTSVMTAHCPPSEPPSASTTRAPTVPGSSCAAGQTLAAAPAQPVADVADDHADDQLAQDGGLPHEAGGTPAEGGREDDDGQLQQDGREGIGVPALAARGMGDARREQREDRAAEPGPPASVGHAPPGTIGPASAPPDVRDRNSLGTGRPASA